MNADRPITSGPPGAQPTKCATCPISVGCSWGCLRADDFAEIARLRSALTEISRGSGPFSRDPLEHATNTIEAMKAAAREALADARG